MSHHKDEQEIAHSCGRAERAYQARLAGPFYTSSGEDIHAIEPRRDKYLEEVKAAKSENDFRNLGREIIPNLELRAWATQFSKQGVSNANKVLAAMEKVKKDMALPMSTTNLHAELQAAWEKNKKESVARESSAPPMLAMKGDSFGAAPSRARPKVKVRPSLSAEAENGILPPEPSSSLSQNKDDEEIACSCGSVERAYLARLHGDSLMTRTLPGIPHEDYRLLVMKAALKLSPSPTTKEFAIAKARVDKELVDRGLGVVIPHAKPGRVTR